MSSQTPIDELKYWIAFNQISPIGPIRQQRLLEFFGDLKTAWLAPRQMLLQAGLEEKIIQEFLNQRHHINPDVAWKKVGQSGLDVITILDETYPKLLKEIYAPPPLLYYRGQFNVNGEFPVAVVGSRKASDYGQQVTRQICRGLAQAGITIVSGLALGIDACSHQTALDNRAKTIAVLGS